MTECSACVHHVSVCVGGGGRVHARVCVCVCARARSFSHGFLWLGGLLSPQAVVVVFVDGVDVCVGVVATAL